MGFMRLSTPPLNSVRTDGSSFELRADGVLKSVTRSALFCDGVGESGADGERATAGCVGVGDGDDGGGVGDGDGGGDGGGGGEGATAACVGSGGGGEGEGGGGERRGRGRASRRMGKTRPPARARCRRCQTKRRSPAAGRASRSLCEGNGGRKSSRF